MKHFLILMMIFMFGSVFSQQKITGRIKDENGIALSGTTIININTDTKTYSDTSGEFSIDASKNDELRFIRVGYERISGRVLTNDSNPFLLITMIKIPEVIEEVKVSKKPTGDLETDSRAVAKVDKGEQVRDAVGLPQPVGKMREKPAEVKQVLIPILLGQLNVQGVYDLISGKARRQKRQYKYDDLQEHIKWVRDRVDDEYFTKAGIPENKISEFIEFSFYEKPYVRTYVKAKNLSGVLLRMEEAIPIYLERLKSSKQ
ncbi:carboxypeptidase regulatory-like domain-containing protein [Chryseobacterium oryctis]|uniref:Carboxypeptidase regulatory-like domain-containing protein n=1 Tax=Chryseobacterium oryctis TaxID=2952618 RepID=A0ABT3HQH8_9FLAO|nr:carboxypeptidase regulatory-like domain-containing protein [Chryseobacterium oryctis]MCW3161999.1 carboxypeptidase regulatory-like domain-containing protein [Chryseobacterium oryctis]